MHASSRPHRILLRSIFLTALLAGHAPARAASPMDAAMTHGMARMQHDMATAPTGGDADQDFVAMMIPHHQGAIDMAQDELRYGDDASLRALARRIVADQRTEIATMRRWQASHGRPAGAGSRSP